MAIHGHGTNAVVFHLDITGLAHSTLGKLSKILLQRYLQVTDGKVRGVIERESSEWKNCI